ncbi:MAG: response regulator [Desulfosarcina sp.]|nr:response regulator [Desulfobacterales bacterium]
MNKKCNLEQELSYLGLLDKAREIYFELGERAVLSYIKSSYRLLSKVYHPDLNPKNQNRANLTQHRLNRVSRLISNMSDMELVDVIRKGGIKKFDGKKKILVVEDEFGLQDIFSNIFIMEGYDVMVATDGVAGYEAFCQFEPDLVFTDVVMPNLNGINLVKKIRKINPDIKVVYTSGFFGIKDLRNDLNQEVLKYNYRTLAKPFKLSAMLTMVKEYFSNSKGTDFIRGV